MKGKGGKGERGKEFYKDSPRIRDFYIFSFSKKNLCENPSPFPP
jgi:hypothetical protein